MSRSTLRLTQFQVEKLRCIGGSGLASPYRITTYRGMKLGQIGPVAQYGWVGSNTAQFDSKLWSACKQLVHALSRRLQ